MGGTTTLPTRPPGGAMEGTTPSIEALITERIRSFELPALLELLATCGYTDANIEYRSHRTLVSHSHLVHAIEFQPGRRVVITVNLGLLSAQSPLPSFLFQAMDQSAPDAMEDFLSYFDHHLLRARFAGLSPQQDPGLVGDAEVARDRLRLLRLSSPSGLHWLCAHVFPEAEVRVRRTSQRQPIPAPGLRLGSSALGAGSAVGGFALVPRSGMEVSLFFNEPFTGDGTPWSHEARERLDAQLLPQLAESSLTLTITLVLRGHSSHALLRQDSYLAYDPLVGAPEHDHVLVLFSGDTAQALRGGKSPPEKPGA